MSSKRIYMDHAATSFPKPPGVVEAMVRYSTTIGASPGRGAYAESVKAGKILDNCRADICALIGGGPAEHVVFTLNCSDALNIAIKGVVRPGDHVITTQLDHNSILRPFNKLVASGHVMQTRLPCDPETGLTDPDDLRRAIRPNTRLFACLHGSNVTGTLQPIEEFGRITQERGVLFLVDAAQTLGHVPLHVDHACIDLLAAPGHKGLLGPLGTGFLYIRPGVEKVMTTLREGGTGSVSEKDVQPDFMPDRFEPGSHNTVGIVGLGEGVKYILDRGIGSMWQHERELMDAFLSALSQDDPPQGLRLLGPKSAQDRCAVFSFRIEGFEDPAALSAALESEYAILTRSGLHCAPGAHETLGTLTHGGTTRLSFGASTTLEEVRIAAQALTELARNHAPVTV